MTTISVITPWLNAPELLGVYEYSTQGVEQVVIVDNASLPSTADMLKRFCDRRGGVYIRNDTNNLFAPANNQGLRAATGDVVVCMNNDVEARPGWLDPLRLVQPGELVGVSKLERNGVPYLEGWLIAARRETWQQLGGWNEDLPGMYYEDNFLCLRALQAGLTLREVALPAYHYNNYTTRQTPGATAYANANRLAFIEAVKQWRS